MIVPGGMVFGCVQTSLAPERLKLSGRSPVEGVVLGLLLVVPAHGAHRALGVVVRFVAGHRVGMIQVNPLKGSRGVVMLFSPLFRCRRESPSQ